MSMNTDWHLRKDITIGNILTAFAALIAAISAWNNLDTRVSLLEQSHNTMKERQNQIEIRILNRLDHIDSKIDKMIERHISDERD